MDKKAEDLLFDQHFLKRGGLYEHDSSFIKRFVERSKDLIENLKNASHLIRKPPKIIFNVIYNPELNACAKIVNDDLYLIGINAGVFFIVDDLSRRILSHKDNLKQIGSPEIEIYSIPTIRNYYNNAKQLIDFGPIDYEHFKNLHPIDKIRDNYARLLLEIILEFVYHHELAHILNGHLKIKRNSYLDFQTLEMDADCIATSQILAKHVRIFKGVIKTSECYKVFYNDIKSVIFFICYALLLFNRITADYPINKKMLLTDLSHSKPRIRQIQIASTILEYFNKYFNDIITTNEITETFGEALVECEKNYISVTGNNVDKASFDEATSDEAKIQVNKLITHWEILKPELEKHSFTRLV